METFEQKNPGDLIKSSDWNVLTGVTEVVQQKIGESGTAAMSIPVMTTVQRDGLVPSTGMVVFNSDQQSVQQYNGTTWAPLGGMQVVGDDSEGLQLVGQQIFNTVTGVMKIWTGTEWKAPYSEWYAG